MTGNLHRSGRQRRMIDKNARLPTDYMTIIREWVSDLPHSPKNNYLKEVIFEKFVDKSTVPAEVRRERAIEKWLSTEAVNEATNLRLLETDPSCVFVGGCRYSEFVEKCCQIVTSIIGDIPLDMNLGSFSGGASTSRVRTASQPARKYVGKAHITSACKDIFDLSAYASWEVTSPIELSIVEGADMFTVPKNADIDRVACKEPDINMFLQKGAGRQIRYALRRCGIDLQDQGRNRRLAQEGSRSGKLATLDLSSASDSISYELVAQLLPPVWFSYLSALRSPKVKINGIYHTCEMFSSMGNGFTFELESLIFYALARTTAYFTRTKGVISVYGDDIIIPSEMFDDFRLVLFHFGFTPNTKKSFSSGPFRESCGGHYWNGDDITPFFIRRPIDRLSELLLFLNNLRIWCSRGQSLFLDSDGWPLWSLLSLDVPRSLKGGDIVSSGRNQLISPGLPRKRLTEVTVKVTLPESGKYLHSLNLIEDRKDIPFLSDTRDSVVLGICRLTNASHWTWHYSGMLFFEEAV